MNRLVMFYSITHFLTYEYCNQKNSRREHSPITNFW